MNPLPLNDDGLLSKSAVLRLNQACLRFEEAWKTGPRPPIDDALGEASGPERLALLGELIRLEVAYRRRSGEAPSPDEYLHRFPDLDPDWLRRMLDPTLHNQETICSETAVEGPCVPAELAGHPRYHIRKELGRGGMGVVYQAEHGIMERRVALKVIKREYTANPVAVERFHREIQAAARLDHPNIVAVYDAEQSGEVHFLVMECIDGVSLDRLVAEKGPLPVAEACEYVRQAALGLHHAHERGMVHRDVKPHNLIRTADGVVKVLDFGLASVVEGGQDRLTRTKVVMGTPNYMAPEQSVDARSADARSDLYALGCTLYHLLAGRPPFSRSSTLLTLLAHRKETPPAGAGRPDVSAELAAILDRMMAKAPADRFQTAAAVAAALEPFTDGRRAGAVAITPALPKAGPVSLAPKRDRRWFVAGALVLLGALSLGAATVIYRIQTDNGELIISTDNPDVEIIARKGGKEVTILDTKSKKEFTLSEGIYDLELNNPNDGLKLEPGQVTIRRGETVLATVTRKKKSTAVVAVVPPPAKPELLFSIPWQDDRQGFPANIYTTGISSDGRLFFGAGDAGPTGAIRVFDLATGKQVQEFLPDGDLWFTFAQFLPGGKYLVASYSMDNDLYLWDVATGKIARKFVGHTENGSQFTASPDGKRLLSWGDDKMVRLWDVDTGKELRKLEGHTDKAAGVFSPDGKQVLTFSRDMTLRLWDVESGKELKKLEGHTDACTGCFSPDGKQALSYGPDGTIRLWDLGTGKEVRRFEGQKAGIDFAGFVAGGRLVVGRSDEHSTDQKLRIWEAASGKLVSEIDYGQYGGDGWTITASPDGRLALVQDKDDGSVRVLDLPSGKEACRYDMCPAARSWSFSPDGTVAVAGSFRAGMYVFRLPSGGAAKP